MRQIEHRGLEREDQRDPLVVLVVRLLIVLDLWTNSEVDEILLHVPLNKPLLSD